MGLKYMKYLFRSMLFVPAYNEKFLDKAAGSEADAIIFDLEDAVPPAKRKTARDILRKYLANGIFEGRQLFVRINELGSDDLTAIGFWGWCRLRLRMSPKSRKFPVC